MATSYTNRTKPTTTGSVTSTIEAGQPIGLLLALTYAVQTTTTTSGTVPSPVYTNRTKPSATTYTNRTKP